MRNLLRYTVVGTTGVNALVLFSKQKKAKSMSTLDPEEYNHVIKGKGKGTFDAACHEYCPSEAGRPNAAQCTDVICPLLWKCVQDPIDRVARDFQQMRTCLDEMKSASPHAGEEVANQIEGPRSEPVEKKGMTPEAYQQHVEGRDAAFTFDVCMTKCPAETGEPNAAQCESHLCPKIVGCLMVDGHAGPWCRLEACLKKLRVEEGDDDGSGEDETKEVEAEMVRGGANMHCQPDATVPYYPPGQEHLKEMMGSEANMPEYHPSEHGEYGPDGEPGTQDDLHHDHGYDPMDPTHGADHPGAYGPMSQDHHYGPEEMHYPHDDMHHYGPGEMHYPEDHGHMYDPAHPNDYHHDMDPSYHPPMDMGPNYHPPSMPGSPDGPHDYDMGMPGGQPPHDMNMMPPTGDHMDPNHMPPPMDMDHHVPPHADMPPPMDMDHHVPPPADMNMPPAAVPPMDGAAAAADVANEAPVAAGPDMANAMSPPAAQAAPALEPAAVPATDAAAVPATDAAATPAAESPAMPATDATAVPAAESPATEPVSAAPMPPAPMTPATP